MGSAEARVPAGGWGRLAISGGLGAVTVVLAAGAAARLTARAGLGKVNLPAEFERMADDRWETAAFAGCAKPVVIDYRGGLGSFRLETAADE